MKNIFLEESCLRSDGVVVDGGYFHYLAHVRRLKRGNRVSAVIGGRAYDLAVRDVGDDAIAFDVLESRRAAKRSGCEIRVFLALLKANKLDYAVARLSELGVSELTLLVTERSVRSASTGADRMKRWARLAREGAKVSGVERLMKLRGPVLLPAAGSDPPGGQSGFPGERGMADATLVFCPGSAHRHVRECLQPPLSGKFARYDLFFGPEGGFTDREIETLAGIGVVTVTMGDFVLRSETAAVVGAGFVRVHCGWGA
jgi:16S rRNA (uracil1498-N3)-methyltransferase